MTGQLKRIAVKIGSNVLANGDGTPDVQRMSDLVDQVAALHAAGISVVLISSGAVASGRGEIKPAKKLDAVSSRQLYSAVGQTVMMSRYAALFRRHNLVCGQVLTSKENFADRTHYLNQKNCMETMLENGVIPVVNENDTVSVTELMFTDNDELSGLVAAMLNMDALIILSNVDGIFDGEPSQPDSRIIRSIGRTDDLSSVIRPGRSAFGRGGMLTKYHLARKVAGEGIPVIIANGARKNILLDLTAGKDVVCTRFQPSERAFSNIRKWIAHSEGFARGEVHIDEGAEKALYADRATSILFVGIKHIAGRFMKDDIVKIINARSIPIGVGRAGYDSEKALSLIGKRNARPMIHCDYLYLDRTALPE
ncbi:MAG: glutamate 5-kinase [Tannerella sp.]|jgi:glutamate 5-kinase|nr:glutamate 5-kinase [Tannerella sp.]